jgi:hypothetical protein
VAEVLAPYRHKQELSHLVVREHPDGSARLIDRRELDELPVEHGQPVSRVVGKRVSGLIASVPESWYPDWYSVMKRMPVFRAFRGAPGVGLEPTTLRLTAECSAD